MTNDERPVGWECELCLFCIADEKIEAPDNLTCVRYPPSVFPIQNQHPITNKTTIGSINAQPQVQPKNWCGEYKNRSEIKINP